MCRRCSLVAEGIQRLLLGSILRAGLSIAAELLGLSLSLGLGLCSRMGANYMVLISKKKKT